MSEQYTPGKLTQEQGGEIISESGWVIADVDDHTGSQGWEPGWQEANARRLVACWNALQGIPIEDIERADLAGVTGRVGERLAALRANNAELLAALEEIVSAFGDNPEQNMALSAAEAAIAKGRDQ